MAQPIRIMIVERDTLFRRGLENALTSEGDRFQIVSAVAAVEDAYREADQQMPDVALVSTTLEGSPGLSLATEMRRRYPAISTIIIGATDSDDELFGAIRAGASAWASRDISVAELFSLIERSAHGEFVINEQLLSKPSVAARILDQFRANTAGDPRLSSAFMPLTDRELEILGKISEGMTNAAIGTNLGISAQTVKNHVTSILRKLAVNDRTQAVVTALQHGWLSLPEIQEHRQRRVPVSNHVGESDS